MILPGAVATMSTWPKLAQSRDNEKRPITVAPIARPIGEGGVSTISRAAGRNSSSSRPRTLGPGGKGRIFFSAFIKSYPKRQSVAPFAGDEVDQLKDQGFNWPKHSIERKYPGLRRTQSVLNF